MTYDTSNSTNEVLPNLIGLKTSDEIGLSEFEGFLRAEIILTENLRSGTKFNSAYILKIHKASLSHLYSFAGKYRDVNMSKAGFPFAAARFLPETMRSFDEEILCQLPNKYISKDQLIKDIAKIHGELLFIHPFREGNGRTARMLVNLMLRKQGFKPMMYERFTNEIFKEYVLAVQASAGKDYQKMEQLMVSIFPD